VNVRIIALMEVNIYEYILYFYSTLGPYIARRRTSEVQKKYAEIGGGSPILKWTNIQVRLLRYLL